MNRLADEGSPYLRQHADNPVDWFPWGDEALARSARLDRPLFLSIGYSACHWCHVMAHESFEDPATAELLNASFVPVKVDREERPDIDAVYMEAVQALTGSGGWPMSVFLTPDGRPFFGGTYFPPEERHGSPSFRAVLEAMRDVWVNRRDEVEHQADEVAAAVASRSTLSKVGEPGAGLGPDPGREAPDLVAATVEELAGRFDPEWGGFGPAPKFPQPSLLDLVLVAADGEARANADGHHPAAASAGHRPVEMAARTLDAMAAGGIHDHLGGGFARYSTDARWLVPHFEKMLYDQAGLARTYLHGWQVTGAEAYRRVLGGIAAYVARDLTLPGGGLASAEDADSEGVEGRFYVWTPAQVDAALAGAGVDDPPAAAAAARDFFGVTEGGNFEGATVLHRPVRAPLTGGGPVEAARAVLLAARGRRARPGRDDKVVTEWNAMYASALAEAAAATGEDAWADSAVATGRFLLDHLRRPDGRWLRTWQEGTGARLPAYAADHAWLVDCFTRLGELTGRAEWTEEARAAADALLTLFADDEGGGFFTTGHDAEALIVRTKDLFDGATPCANSVAGLALARLGALTGESRYTRAAWGVVDLYGDLLERHPAAFPLTVLTATLLRRGIDEVVVVGDRPDLVAAVRGAWRPGAVLAWGEPSGSPLWRDRLPGQAYVCRHATCRLPATDVGTLLGQLSGSGSGSGSDADGDPPSPGRRP